MRNLWIDALFSVTTLSCYNNVSITLWDWRWKSSSLFDLGADRKHGSSPVATHTHTHTDGWTAWFDFPLRHLLCGHWSPSFLLATDSSFMDWVTNHITYPPDIHSPPPPSLLELSHGVWCPFCAPGGSHILWIQDPAWEVLPRGSRIAEGLSIPPPPIPGFLMEACCIIYVAGLVKVVPILLVVLIHVMPLYRVFKP